MSLFQFTPQGILTVDTSEILTDVQEAYKTALGSDLELEASSSQGQLITNDTKFLQYAQEQGVLSIASFDPLTAKGSALDAVAEIWGYFRKKDIPSVVQVRLTGVPNTIVPSGTLFSDGTNQWALLDQVVIGSAGFNVGQAQCTTAGSISLSAGKLNTIVNPVSGLETVNNDYPATVGSLEESDNVFRKRITANWFNIRGRSVLGAIIDNIAQLPDVLSVVGRENYTGSTRLIDGVPMVAHSIYLDVLGGSGSDIAKVIMQQKTLGAACNGSTEVSYYDPISQYNYSYLIDRPNPVNVYIQVEYEKNPYTPADIVEQIQNQLSTFVNNNPFLIGDTVSGNSLYQAFSGFGYADILSINVSTTNGDYQDYITTNIQQVPVLDISNISVVEVSADGV